ncbi:MAG: hypothetical protein AAFN93_09180 [Bacteroidota bacterium]
MRFKSLIKSITVIVVTLWSLLTLVVVFSLFDRFYNPGYKGITNLDIKHYLVISAVTVPTIIGLWRLGIALKEKDS